MIKRMWDKLKEYARRHVFHMVMLGAIILLGAAQFSLIMAAGNVGEMGGAAVSGSLISLLGFSRIFLYSGWFYGPALLVLYFIRFKSKLKKKTKL